MQTVHIRKPTRLTCSSFCYSQWVFVYQCCQVNVFCFEQHTEILQKYSLKWWGCFCCCLYLSISPSSPVTEQKSNDKVIFYCYVFSYEGCRHSVEWVYEGKENISSVMEISSRSCNSNVAFETSHFNQKSILSELLFVRCKVTDEDKRVQLFPFSPPSSGEKT